MSDMGAIRVKILAATGRRGMDYPDFNALPVVQAWGADWKQYVDAEGIGWVYDRSAGLYDDKPGSPHGQQWGAILAPPVFCDQAVALFPDRCTRLTEAQLRDFYDSRIGQYERDVEVDVEALSAYDKIPRIIQSALDDGDIPLAVAQALRSRLRQARAEALDPTSNAQGIRENPRRTWSRFKAQRGFTFVDPA